MKPEFNLAMCLMFVVTPFPVSFQMVIESTTEQSKNLVQEFAKSGIKTSFVKDLSNNTYKIFLNDELDVLRAGIICLRNLALNEGNEFYPTLEKISTIFHKIEKPAPLDIENQLLDLIRTKHRYLKDIQHQLNSLALKFNIKVLVNENREVNSCEEGTANIQEIINYNINLFNSINQKAKEQCTQYNSVAIKALVMAISSSYLEKNHPEPFSQAKEAYVNHQDEKKQLLKQFKI